MEHNEEEQRQKLKTNVLLIEKLGIASFFYISEKLQRLCKIYNK